jgi:hypothetical protein
MASLTSEALELAIRQHGLITTEQLARCGVGRTTRTGLVRQRLLHHEFKSVFRLPGPQSSLEQRCAVLCLAHPSVFVTGATGGRLRGLRRLPRVAPLTISSLHPLHLSHRGVLHRRTTKLIPDDVEVRPDGLRVAEPHRLAFDLAATLDDRAFRSVIEQMLHEGLVTTSGLARVGQRLVHPTRPGSHRFMRTMAQRSGKAFESDPEIAVADALLARGVPVVAQTTWLDLPNGGRARLDLSVPDVRWGVEVDVHPSHLGIEGTASDKRRDRQCHLIGWQIERVTVLDLLDLEHVAAELAALFAVRCEQVA